jgi:hypothetical protein
MMSLRLLPPPKPHAPGPPPRGFEVQPAVKTESPAEV